MASYKKQISFILICILVCIALVASLFFQVRQSAVREMNERQRIYARLAARGIESILTHYMAILETLAQNPHVVAMDNEGRILLKTSDKAANTYLKGIIRLNAKGVITYTFPPGIGSSGTDLSGENHVRKVLSDRKLMVSDVFEAVQGFQSVALHVPVYRGKNFDGTVGILVDFSQLARDYLDNLNVADKRYALLINSEGKIIHCHNPEHAGRTLADFYPGNTEAADLIKKMTKGEEGEASFYDSHLPHPSKESQKVHAVYTPIRAGGDFWSIAVVSSEELMLPATQNTRYQIIILALVLMAFFVMVVYAAARIRSASVEERKRRKIEDDLVKSAEEIRDLYHNAPCGYHSLDAGGRIVRINDMELAWLGYTREELIGKAYADILSAASTKLFADAFDRLKNEGMVRNIEYEMVRKDGTTFPVLVTASAITDDTGQFVMSRSMVVDMTLRRAQEERLRESEILYRTALETTSDGITIVQNRKYVYANKKLMETIGRPDESLIGQTAGIFVHPDDRWLLLENYQAFVKGTPMPRPSYELRVLKPDGSVVLVNAFTVLITYHGQPAVLSFITDITRQKQYETALRESEALYRKALENTSDGVTIVQDGRYVYTSQRLLSTIGRPDLNLIGSLQGAYVYPDDWSKVIEAFQKRQKGDPIPSGYEVRVLKPDESTVFLHVTAVTVRYQGRPAILSFIRDVTKQKEAEKALRESEELYRTALESTSDGITITDIQKGTYLYVNQKMMETLGRPPDNLIGSPVDLYVHPDDMGLGRKHYRKRKKEGKAASYFESRVIKADGSLAIVSVTATDIIFQGRPAVISFIQDITEKKRQDDALRESEELYRTALESTSDGVTILQDGIYVYVNQKFLNTMGVPLNAIINRPLGVLAGPEPQQGFKEFLTRHPRQKPGPDEQVTRVSKADGSVIYLQSSSVDIVYQGKPAILTFIKNITEQKKAEQALRESEELYRTAFEKTHDGISIMQEDKHVFVNQRLLQTLGRREEELIGQPLGAYVHPDDLAKLDQYYTDRIQGRSAPSNYDIRVLKPDGGTVMLNINAIRINYKGNPATLSFVTDITERKRAEEALRESEELYRTALEKTNDGISILQEGKYVYANQKLLKTIGREKTGLDGLPLGIFIHPDDRDMVRNRYEARQRGERLPSNYDFRVLKPDGSVIVISISSVVITYKGKPATLSFILDITERKKAEEALRESEELYRTALENTSDGISIVQENRYVYVNQKFLHTIGREESEIIRRPLGIFIHPDDAEKVKKNFTARVRGDQAPASYDIRIVKPDGSYVTLNIRAVKIDYQGKPATLSFIIDVTERIRAQEALRQSEERYRTIIESIDDDYFETDLDGVITFFNRPVTCSGISREELIGTNHRQFVTPETEKKITRFFKQVYGSGKPQRMLDYEVLRKDGAVGHQEISLSLMRNAEGKPVGFRGVSRDVSERFRMEDEQRRLTEQLHQAQKMEAIGTLAGGIAHDFNNLLMGIQGYTSLMLLDVEGTHPHSEQLRAVQALVQSGAGLTRQLLGFARAGRYEVVPTDINDLISKSVNLFARTKKEISIFEKYAENIWTVDVDRGQIEQVLLNMFVNAWQAMPGGGSLYLETQNTTMDEPLAAIHDVKQGRYVKISITDTGVGMDERTRQRIFDPFFTTKEMGRGTGLGLASAYGIIKGHSGMISVYSEKGQGTTFNIYLPASLKNVPDEEAADSELFGGRETILLVDDEEIITEVTGKLLAELGYKIITAQSGTEAVDIYTARHTEIDLVIIDMIMPGLSGSDTFDRLKAINPAVRTILSSGYSVNGKAKAIMDRGVRVFLQKPYRLHDLAQKIRDALAD